MKITKEQLKQIIKEELERLNEVEAASAKRKQLVLALAKQFESRLGAERAKLAAQALGASKVDDHTLERMLLPTETAE